MQRRSAIQKHRMPLGDFLEDVPNFACLAFDHLLGRPHSVDVAKLLEAPDNERLEQHERHLLRQSALVELQLGPDHDDRAARVVHALTEQVLPEAARLALEHVGKGFQSPIASTGDSASVTTVVVECVHSFLQHTLLVANDDFWRFKLQKILQPVIPVDDATVEIVEIRSGETPTLQRNEWSKVGRNHWQNRQDHPLRPGLGPKEALQQFDPLRELLADLLALGFRHRHLQLLNTLGQVHATQGFADGLGTHLGREGIRAIGITSVAIFLLGEQLVRQQRRGSGINDQVVLVVNHPLQIAGSHVQHQPDAARHALEEPNVAHRHGQFDVPHALTPHPRQRHFDAAAIAHDPPVLDALVLTARTFPVLDRTKNTLTEQATLFGLEGAVVDGFRVLDFTLRP